VIALFGLCLLLIPRETRRGAALTSALAVLSCDGAHHDRMLAPIEDYPRTAVLYLGDLAGSPVAEVSDVGDLVMETAYRAYGSARSATGADAEPFAYVGNEADRGSGLADFGARPMRPEMARFYAVDPMSTTGAITGGVAPSALQAYTYAAGDPVNMVDPHGAFVIGIGIGGQVAFGVVGEGGAGFYFESTSSRMEVGFYSTMGAGAGISGGGEFSLQLTVSPYGTAADAWGSPSVSVSSGAVPGVGGGISITPNLDNPMSSVATVSISLGTSLDIIHASVSVGVAAPILTSDGHPSQPTPRPEPDSPGVRHEETTSERRMDAAGAGFDGGTPRASSSRTVPAAPQPTPTESSTPAESADPCGRIMSCQ
jgi:RHS repeat-associated protein